MVKPVTLFDFIAPRIPHHHNNGNTDPRYTRGRGRGNYQNRGDRPLHP